MAKVERKVVHVWVLKSKPPPTLEEADALLRTAHLDLDVWHPAGWTLELDALSHSMQADDFLPHFTAKIFKDALAKVHPEYFTDEYDVDIREVQGRGADGKRHNIALLAVVYKLEKRPWWKF